MNHQCQCGEITGTPCEWSGPVEEMRVIETMPLHLRASHEAAGNPGRYPMNGAERLALQSGCAEMAVATDPEWTTFRDADPEQYL